ncbi:NUDIX domain-containing protein [Micromonospora sp. DT15]|uniref:NUDIX domain-containing protein n=1 Tax=Micromonospora sp. DT15 TaxID=3393445 RepID=UPI003CFBBB75
MPARALWRGRACPIPVLSSRHACRRLRRTRKEWCGPAATPQSNPPGIPGSLGSARGHVDAGESELQALAREMREELGVHIVAESASRLGDWHGGSGEDAVHVGVWQIRDWVGSPTNRARYEHDDIAWVGISELSGLPLVFGALPALLGSLPEPDRLPRRDEARTTASPGAEIRCP